MMKKNGNEEGTLPHHEIILELMITSEQEPMEHK